MPSQLQTLWDIFKDIDLDNNGTISRVKFEIFLKRKSPAVVPHAQAMYKACTVQGGKSDDEEFLDFQSLLRALYPAASRKDISQLMSFLKMSKGDSVTAEEEKKNNKLLVEAREQFSMYNISNDGALTRQQFTDGMISFGISEEEREANLEELFVDQPHSDFVEFEDFFKWYTSMDSLPTTRASAS